MTDLNDPGERERIREMQRDINRRRAPHRRECAINDPAYAGGPCSCGLVDPSNNDPLGFAKPAPSSQVKP